MTEAERPTWRSTLALGCWLGIALTLARAIVLLGMDHYVRAHSLETVLWRIDARLPCLLIQSFVVGLLLARLAQSQSRLPAIPVGTALGLFLLSGYPFDDAFHIPDIASDRGRQSLIALAAASLLIVITSRSVQRWLPGLLSASAGMIAILLGLASPWLLRSALDADEQMRVVRVERDLTDEPDTWDVVRARPEHPPTAGTLTTERDYKVDGGDRPALLLPPPASLRFRTSPDDPPLTLRAATGASLEAGRDGRSLRAHFSIALNGEEVFEEERQFEEGDAPELRSWHDVAGEDGIEVPPGSTIEFRIDAVGEQAWPAEVAIGFGAARLERIAERKRARATADSPSIVFVVMDTLRADRTSLHGYEKPTTPVLDSLAERGVTFERAYSTSSWTWPSTASLLTGLAPEAHGVTSSRSCFLAHELETLPERLQQRGYTTAAFAANPLIAPDKNFDQGFESFSATRSRFLPSDVVVPDVLEWLDRNAGRRFFLYVHLVDPHEPHKPRPEFERSMTSGKPADLPEGALTKYGEAMLRMSDEERARHVPPEHARWMSEVYDASVATGDYWFGQILEKLNELQLRDNTIVAFTSDHGEELLEHGMLKHGHALWEELVHVPLVIAGPGIAQGVRISTPLSNRELPLSLAVRAGAPFEAIDARLDLTRPGELVEEDVFFSTENGWLNGKRDQTIIGIRDDAWTVHFRPPHKANEELRVLGSYDNTTDPMQLRAWSASDEERNSSQPRVERALRQVSRWREHAPQVRAAGAGTIDVLRGVGYLGDED